MAGSGRKSRSSAAPPPPPSPSPPPPAASSPPQPSPPPPSAALQTLVLDNGGHTLKTGLATDQRPRVIANCLARDRHRRVYVGSELDESCRDFGEVQFRRPVDRGFIVNWEAQKHIWDRELFDGHAGGARIDPAETRLVLAEAPGALPTLQGNCDQIVFEEYQFASYYRGIGTFSSPVFNAYHDVPSILQTSRRSAAAAAAATVPEAAVRLPAEVVLVVDCGYSHTTVTPVLSGRPLHSAVRRLDIGGKIMTNYLTRLLSVRHFDMRSDPHIVNDIKEAACFVSQDFGRDLDLCWKGTRGREQRRWRDGDAAGIARDYILPDFHTRTRGELVAYDPARHAKRRGAAAAQKRPAAAAAAPAAAAADDEDLITLRNERFAVPEIVFNPSDIGLAQLGLADAVMQSVHELPIGLWPSLLLHVLVVGGCGRIPGFVDRLQREIMQRAPDECLVRVGAQPDPVVSTWQGGANLARHAHMERLAVTRQEYEEHGGGWVGRKFAAGLGGL